MDEAGDEGEGQDAAESGGQALPLDAPEAGRRDADAQEGRHVRQRVTGVARVRPGRLPRQTHHLQSTFLIIYISLID